MSIDVSVIVPCCNQGEWPRLIVPKIHVSLGRISREVIVVDDHSTDGCCTGLGELATVLLPRTRLGCSGSRHFAIERSSGQVIILVDPHCELQPNALAELARHAAKSPGFWQPRVRLSPPDVDARGYAGAKLIIQERGLVLQPVRDSSETNALWGSIYAFDRDVLQAVFGELGWPVLPGVWGCEEQPISVMAWLADVPISVDDSVLCRHVGYEKNQFPYPMPKTDWAANCHWGHSAVFPETYLSYWLPMLESHFGKAPASRLPMTDKETMPIYGALCKHVASTRKHSESECFSDLLKTPYPPQMKTDSPLTMSEAELIKDQAGLATPHDHPEAHGRIVKSLQWLLQNIPGCLKGRKALVVGCGDGHDAERLHQLGCQTVEGVELVPVTAKWADDNRSIKIRQGDMRNLPDATGTWDLVVSNHSFEHLPEPELGRKELSRVLKPGGWLYIAVPREEYPNSGLVHGAHHAAWASPESLIEFLAGDPELDPASAISVITDAKLSHHREIRVLIRKRHPAAVRTSRQVSVLRFDCQSYPLVSRYCRRHLRSVMPRGAQLVEVKQHPTAHRSNFSLWINLVCGLGQCPPGPVYVADADCLYPPEYFLLEPVMDAINRSRDMLFLDQWGFHPRTFAASSTMFGDRDFLRKVLSELMQRWSEEIPNAVFPKDGTKTAFATLKIPAIDIRHGKNLTGARAKDRTDAHFDSHPYWGEAKKLYAEIMSTANQ